MECLGFVLLKNRSSNNQTNKYNKSSFIKVVVGKVLKVLNQLKSFCRGYSIIVYMLLFFKLYCLTYSKYCLFDKV